PRGNGPLAAHRRDPGAVPALTASKAPHISKMMGTENVRRTWPRARGRPGRPHGRGVAGARADTRVSSMVFARRSMGARRSANCPSLVGTRRGGFYIEQAGLSSTTLEI